MMGRKGRYDGYAGATIESLRLGLRWLGVFVRFLGRVRLVLGLLLFLFFSPAARSDLLKNFRLRRGQT